MIIDPANPTNSYIQTKSELENSPDVTKQSNVNNDGIPEAGQTSEIGPAVVPNISAAALETSRAINAPEQDAAQNETNDLVTAEEKGQLPSANKELTGQQNLPNIDTSV